MTDITLRTAKIEDLPTLLAFEQHIIEAERPYDETLRPDPISYYDIKGMIGDDDTEVIVAVHEEVIVASAYAAIREAKPYLRHTQYAYLGFMFVVPSYRGMGINGAIVDALKAWSQSRNINELRLDVYDENNSAIRAYKKAGFKKHLINMRISIS